MSDHTTLVCPQRHVLCTSTSSRKPRPYQTYLQPSGPQAASTNWPHGRSFFFFARLLVISTTFFLSHPVRRGPEPSPHLRRAPKAHRITWITVADYHENEASRMCRVISVPAPVWMKGARTEEDDERALASSYSGPDCTNTPACLPTPFPPLPPLLRLAIDCSFLFFPITSPRIARKLLCSFDSSSCTHS